MLQAGGKPAESEAAPADVKVEVEQKKAAPVEVESKETEKPAEETEGDKGMDVTC